jgi:hypothetical protein
MIVNLSLERSGKFTLEPNDANAKIEMISAVDGSLSTFAKTNQWLAAGNGMLLKFQ